MQLLYFAVVRDLVGRRDEDVELPTGVDTIGSLSAWLEQTHEPLRGRMVSIRIARNERFATANDRIEPGDTLALIPPVAGG